MKSKKHPNKNSIALVLKLSSVLVILCLCLGLRGVLTNYNTYQNKIEYLDSKRDTVLSISAASATTSTLLSLLPDDTATPIANKLSDVTEYSLLVVAVIYTEKYLVTALPWLALTWIIPGACICYLVAIAYSYFQKKRCFLEKISYASVLIGMVMLMIMPLSIGVSQQIQKTYDAEITAKLEEASSVTENLYQYEETDSWLDKAISTVTDTIEYAKVALTTSANNFIEGLGILIVTCFVIPLVTALIIVGLCKMLISSIFKYVSLDDPSGVFDHLANQMTNSSRKILNKPSNP